MRLHLPEHGFHMSAVQMSRVSVLPGLVLSGEGEAHPIAVWSEEGVWDGHHEWDVCTIDRRDDYIVEYSIVYFIIVQYSIEDQQ